MITFLTNLYLITELYANGFSQWDKLISFILQDFNQPFKVTFIEFIRAAGVRPEMDQHQVTIQSFGSFYRKYFIVDCLATPVVLHVRCGIVGIAGCAGGEVNHLDAHILCPRCNLPVVIFVRRYVERSVFKFNAGLSHHFVAFQQIFFKLFARHQQRIAVPPRAVQQMSVTVTADVVPLFQQALHYVRIEFVKFSGKEECSFDTLLFQSTDDGVRSVALSAAVNTSVICFWDGSVRTMPPLL